MFFIDYSLQVPWSRLGQDPVLVQLDHIFLLAEPATHVEGSSEDAVQEVRKNRIRVGRHVLVFFMLLVIVAFFIFILNCCRKWR